MPAGWDRLHEAGNFHDLELAAGLTAGDVRQRPAVPGQRRLQVAGGRRLGAGGPELAPESAGQLGGGSRETRELLTAAQQPDGYLDSHFQVRFPGERFVQLPWGHELYCAGHLIQAAVALHRTNGDDELLDAHPPAGRPGGGELRARAGTRSTASAVTRRSRRRWSSCTGRPASGHTCETARYFIDRRGHGLLGDGRFGRHYWQDHLPIREAPGVAGHAVRQLYLLAGAADVYAETGDRRC